MKISLGTIIAVLSVLLFMNVSSAAQESIPRFEIGGQFSLISRNKPTPIFSSPTIVPDDFDHETRAGFGGRFSYNLTDYLAVEAEGNFFPKTGESDLSVPDGHIYQGQFGVKAGQRFSKVGIFAKVRPGFVGFSRVSQLTGTRTITFLNQQFTVGDFRIGRESFFSTDIGGVFEVYLSRRIMTRFDIGDTIIRYGRFRREGISLSQAILERGAETRHNLQFSAGIGLRF
ncbi:MAG TPA: outer membrane beta-barrel protein [Pyrinomonadaceae bacterium]|nr:outer membrane beta-barrel protein [Pyrinomonadaceae bacterium]